MKLFKHNPEDATFAINRCFFEADNGRPSLAVDRLQDLAQKLLSNPHVSYAEGIIWRDHLGQGETAFNCFKSAYEFGSSKFAKRNTLRLAAYNAAMLAPTESDFRKWAGIAQHACGWWHRNDRRFLADCVRELDRGVRYTAFLVHIATEVHGKANEPGPMSAVLETALKADEMPEETTFNLRKQRALKLRVLDLHVQNLREGMGEDYAPDERTTLQAAIEELDNALELDEYDATLWNSRSAWLGLLDRHEEAIASADHAIKLRPNKYARPHVNKAYSLWRLGRTKEALAAINEAARHAEQENSAEQIEQARVLADQYAKPDQAPQGPELRATLARILQAALQTAHRELDQAREAKITIDLMISELLARVRPVTHPATEYAPMVAQLLGDFTPETGWMATCQANEIDRRVGECVSQATVYYALKSSGAQRRDAARLLSLLTIMMPNVEMMRSFLNDLTSYSFLSRDDSANVEQIVSGELRRLNRWLPSVIME